MLSQKLIKEQKVAALKLGSIVGCKYELKSYARIEPCRVSIRPMIRKYYFMILDANVSG